MLENKRTTVTQLFSPALGCHKVAHANQSNGYTWKSWVLLYSELEVVITFLMQTPLISLSDERCVERHAGIISGAKIQRVRAKLWFPEKNRNSTALTPTVQNALCGTAAPPHFSVMYAWCMVGISYLSLIGIDLGMDRRDIALPISSCNWQY